MAIDHYDVMVPAYIESGVPFEVRIIARDSGGAIVDDDVTSITLSSSSSDILFDADGDENYGEVGDNIDTLTDGIVALLSLDTKGASFTLSVEDLATQTITGEEEVAYNFNCILFSSEAGHQSELTTLEHQEFQRRNAANNVGLEYEEAVPNIITLDSFERMTTAGI